MDVQECLNRIVLVDRFYPSSKKCSGCDWTKGDLKLSDREFICENCGMVKDRDHNAAININNFGLNKIGMVNPKLTPMDKEALAVNNNSETALDEVGISMCIHRK